MTLEIKQKLFRQFSKTLATLLVVIYFFSFVLTFSVDAITNSYNIQPTSLTDTTTTISWASTSAEDSKVSYGPTVSYGSSLTNATLTTTHSVALIGLIPGTTYHYTVGDIGGSDVSPDLTFTTPYDWGLITANTSTGVDTSHTADEFVKGIKTKTLELAWSAYEPSNGTFDSTYIAAKKAEMATYQAQGFEVVLDIGSHYPASWVSSIDGNTLFKNQYGDTFQPASPGKNVVNVVFNNNVRSALSTYIQTIFQDFGTNFYAVRAGGGWYGELHYPEQSYNGRTNSYWGYDANAQGLGGSFNLPAGVNSNPVPGWIPNPVKNGTFENGADGNWLPSAQDSFVTSGAHRGSKALQKINPGAWSNQTQQIIQVVPGRTYNYSFWAKTSNTITPPCLQILKTSDNTQIALKCIYSTIYAVGTSSFIPTENTVKLALVTYDGGTATMTFDDVSIADSEHAYDATNANATAFWNWYKDSLINYQNWQIAQYRTAGFNNRIFMLYPSYGVRPDANVNQITQAIGYDLSQTTGTSINGELQQGSDFYDEIAGLVDSQNNIYPYCTWLDMATANDASADKGDWSPAKYISNLAINNNRIASGENTGNGSYLDMQRMVDVITSNHLAGGYWFNEPQLYGGIFATLANYQTQITANDGSAPYNLSLVINSGGSFGSQLVPLTVSATDNVSSASDLQMRLGNDSSFTGSSWQSYNTSTSFNLPTGNSDRTIYLQVKDVAGNISNVYTANYSVPSISPTPTSVPDSSSNPPHPSENVPSSGPGCTNIPPSSTPDLFQIDVTDTTAKVSFTPIGNTNHYYLSFSLKSTAEEHGAEVALSSAGVQSFTVNQLKPKTTYYFKVRGQNGCLPGNWSNILKTTTSTKGATRLVSVYKTTSIIKKISNLVTKIKNKIIPPQTSTSSPSLVVTLPTPKSYIPTSIPDHPQPTSIPPQPKSTPVSPPPQPKKFCILWFCF